MIPKRVYKLGNLFDIITQGRSVYDTKGISPTLLSGMSHGNTVPYIIEVDDEETDSSESG